MRVLAFTVRDQRVALPLDRAREVLEQPRITPLPGSPPQLLGLAVIRGDIMPVYDTSQLFGWADISEVVYVVVVESEGDLAGLAVNDLPMTMELGERVDGSELTAGEGVFQDDIGMVTLVNVDTLLAPARSGAWQS